MRKVALISIVFFILVLSGCSTFNQNYKLATDAAANKDWDKAIDRAWYINMPDFLFINATIRTYGRY